MLPRLTVLQASSVPKIKVVHIQRLLTHQSVYFEGKESSFFITVAAGTLIQPLGQVLKTKNK